MKCGEVQENLSLYLYGELNHQDEEAVERHIHVCEPCRRALESERLMHSALDAMDSPPAPSELAACRRELFQAIETARPAVPTVRERVASWFAMSWMQPVAAMALLAVGFTGGRLIPGKDAPAPVATRVRYVQPDGAGRINLVLEETRERRVSGDLSDARIRGLVLAASRDEADPGLRMESFDVLRREASTSEIRRALTAALVSDGNPGVRMKALEGLKPHTSDPDVRRALSQVLLRDENPSLRAQAIDLLVQHRNRDVVDVLQQLMSREENDYVRQRTVRVLSEMNASVDAF